MNLPTNLCKITLPSNLYSLKTESSFASDPQVLIDQLKFIIDSNHNLTAQ